MINLWLINEYLEQLKLTELTDMSKSVSIYFRLTAQAYIIPWCSFDTPPL